MFVCHIILTHPFAIPRKRTETIHNKEPTTTRKMSRVETNTTPITNAPTNNALTSQTP